MPTNEAQQLVPIKEIRDGIILRSDNKLSAIVLVNSINLALKSNDERTAIIGGFQNFLNALDINIQIVVQSRRVDISGYLERMEGFLANQKNELLALQTKEYIQFIKDITNNSNVVSKEFFVIVTINNSGIQGKGNKGILSIFKKGNNNTEKDLTETIFQLQQRVEVVRQGLARSGLRGVQLDTNQVIELLYKTYNPQEDVGI